MSIENTDQVRSVLIEEIDLIKKGESNPSRANAVANLVGKILSSVKLDIEVQRYIGEGKAARMNTKLLAEKKKK